MPDITLADEARYLHRHFFGGPPPPEVVERYAQACGRVLGEEGEHSGPLLRKVVGLGLDPEAVEIALRLRGNRTLTRKIQTLFYLVEVRAEYLPFFFNQRPGLARGLWAVLAATAAGTRTLVRGLLLVRRHGLA